MSQGIILTIPGVDAGTVSNPNDYILNTDYPVLKVQSEGEGTITLGIGVTVGTATLTHNLGYRANTWVYADQYSGGTATGYRARSNRQGNIDLQYNANNTEVVVRETGGTSSSRAFGYYYYVFYDKVTTI